MWSSFPPLSLKTESRPGISFTPCTSQSHKDPMKQQKGHPVLLDKVCLFLWSGIHQISGVEVLHSLPPWPSLGQESHLRSSFMGHQPFCGQSTASGFNLTASPAGANCLVNTLSIRVEWQAGSLMDYCIRTMANSHHPPLWGVFVFSLSLFQSTPKEEDGSDLFSSITALRDNC